MWSSGPCAVFQLKMASAQFIWMKPTPSSLTPPPFFLILQQVSVCRYDGGEINREISFMTSIFLTALFQRLDWRGVGGEGVGLSVLIKSDGTWALLSVLNFETESCRSWVHTYCSAPEEYGPQYGAVSYTPVKSLRDIPFSLLTGNDTPISWSISAPHWAIQWISQFASLCWMEFFVLFFTMISPQSAESVNAITGFWAVAEKLLWRSSCGIWNIFYSKIYQNIMIISNLIKRFIAQGVI